MPSLCKFPLFGCLDGIKISKLPVLSSLKAFFCLLNGLTMQVIDSANNLLNVLCKLVHNNSEISVPNLKFSSVYLHYDSHDYHE